MTVQKELDEWNRLPDDYHDWDDDHWERVDAAAKVLSPPQPQPRTYNSVLVALCQGAQHRVLLLKDGYEFNAAHSLKDVQPYELEADGYPPGGAAIALTVTDNHRIELSEVKFENIAENTIVGGATIYNERGLIAHLPVAFKTKGDELVLREER